MILVYVDNKEFGEVAEIVKKFDVFSYRNPRHFDKPEKCDGVYIHGEWPKVRAAYDNIIEQKIKTPVVEKDTKTSADFTISQLREMKPAMSEDRWESFTKGDERKSIKSL